MAPPNPPKLIAKAKHVKGCKTVERICDEIRANADYVKGQKMTDANMEVLLDATGAMEAVQKRYSDGEMNGIAHKMFNGSEDDWGSDSWRSVAEAWTHVLQSSPEFITKEIIRKLNSTNCGDFEEMYEVLNSDEFEEIEKMLN